MFYNPLFSDINLGTGCRAIHYQIPVSKASSGVLYTGLKLIAIAQLMTKLH